MFLNFPTVEPKNKKKDMNERERCCCERCFCLFKLIFMFMISIRTRHFGGILMFLGCEKALEVSTNHNIFSNYVINIKHV